ncbi:type VI secretion system Vgr family protein [Piscinibacter gummiphilus]|uniref:Type VI secretion system Vgr family protein n=1 Tax=Piscinibacter gummiphilus TaxID=946333 RepID=A0ABZ0CPW1_9BURK|nr:type VI secretion system Vgr family protein [Piscinibacter gummiphilus]WOB07030.1 type VI secretion system Vgr family protein [Piscinibacter gummiphilus]
MSALSALSAVQSVVQAVLAALGPNQNQRLLRLHTPLGSNVLLAERLLGTETIGPRAPGVAPSAGFKFEVLALSTNAHLRLKDLIGQPVRVDLLTGQSLKALRPFHGHVTAFALLGSDGGLARYKLTVEPWLSVLAHRQDAWVFQDKTVMEILDEVFADYQAQGKLAPAWRWELADASVYARRSLCVQYHESDLAFVQRLMAEEGLFSWFEHEASEGDTLGQHTLVIADHNGCFKPNVQSRVRYTQSASASFKEDSITRFDEARRVAPTVLSAASWDHRSVSQPAAEATGDERISANSLALALRDQPGTYAYETASQAERLVRRHLEAVQAPGFRYQGEGALRHAACGTTFSLAEHPSVSAADQWVTLTVQHRARNNITADLSTSLQSLLGKIPQAFGETQGEQEPRRSERPSLFKGPANATTEPLYLARFLAQDASLPVRGMPCLNEQGDLTFARPKVVGTQTAIVVGLSEPVHTDRDGRIKIQFHWQRGAQSALRLDHPAGSNAPGDDSSGTWVRVAQPWAGANWGGHFTPRLGQEVLVSFVEDDIDRPVVIGSAYNGVGSADAQGNQVGAGSGTATGNAAAWFPGAQKVGELEGHQHPHVLAGFKSQSLESSASGTGGHNQLVFDDSPAQARAQLSSTTASSWLQIGHLLQQNDNQRLAKRGHGLDLSTTAYGAVRAAAGLYLSADARTQGSQASAQPVDARTVVAQLESAAELTQALNETAQKHNAKLSGELEPKDLPVRKGQQSAIESLEADDSRGDAVPSGSEIVAIQGGAGRVSAWSRPELLISAPGGVGAATPAQAVLSAGTNASLSAGQDLNFESQRNTALAVKSGLTLFTYGKAQNKDKPNAETGMQLHAASGSVSVQAQGNTLHLTADKAVNVSSVTNAITMGSPKHVLLTAGGASLRVTNGSITLTTSGAAQFKAAMKELTGASGASSSLIGPKPTDIKGCAQQSAQAAGSGGVFVG